MRTVYDNAMVAHLWANQSQSDARTGNGNFSYDGTDLYSYTTMIARIIVGADGSRAALFTRRSYSVTTTTKHMGPALSAARHLTTMHVWDVSLSPDVQREKMLLQREHLMESTAVARNRVSRAKRFGEAVSYVHSANHYLSFVGLEPIPAIPSDDALTAELDAIRERNRAENERREKAMQREAAKRRRKAKSALKLWLTNSDRYGIFYGLDSDRMKVLGDEVVTTRGATVPLDHVRRVAPVVLGLIRAGKTYQANGHTIHVGQFALDSIDDKGTVRAGCHTFARSEIERFARVLDALPALSTADAI